MTFRSNLAALALLASLAACAPPPPAGSISANAAARADCREQVDRQYNAQNRADLTRRDERDFAFAGSYNSGISSRGLSAEYQRDNMIDGCLKAVGARGGAVPGVGPANSPVERGTGAPSLQP